MSVQALQDAMLKLPQFEPPTSHTFHAGMYLRAVEQPAGSTVVGALHKVPHFFYLAVGCLAVVDGEVEEIIHAPRLLCTEPGAKRALFAVSDCLYFTIHRTDTTDVESAEDEMVEPDPSSPFLVGNKLPRKELT